MSDNTLKLGTLDSETTLPQFGRKFAVEQDETTREARTVNGTMKKDIMYVKHKFKISYSEIYGTDLNTILTIYENIAQPMNFIVNDGTKGDGSQQNFTVYMDIPDRKRFRVQGDGLWKGVSFTLVEA